MNHFEKVFQCFPSDIRQQMDSLPADVRDAVEEVRVYRGGQVRLLSEGRWFALQGIVSAGHLSGILNSLMKFSYYAYEEDLAKGFITIDGGHRVGICGKAVVDKGRVKLLRDISSLNIRCSHEVTGCSDSLMPLILDENRRIRNILVVSPPGCGKTTLLRDIARNLGIRGFKVAICDERSEIAGMDCGCSPYALGPMTDVLDGCPKAEGMIMLIRSMSPHVIITDEIGRQEDVYAIKSCISSGVAVITSVHGSDMDDLKRLEIYETIERGTFDTAVFLTDRPRAGTVKEVHHFD